MELVLERFGGRLTDEQRFPESTLGLRFKRRTLLHTKMQLLTLRWLIEHRPPKPGGRARRSPSGTRSREEPLAAITTFSASGSDITPSSPVAPAPSATSPARSTTSTNARKDSISTGPKYDLELSTVHIPNAAEQYRLKYLQMTSQSVL